MSDYFNKPWGWAQPQSKTGTNVVSPLGASPEQAPGAVQVGPSAKDQAVAKVGNAVANKAVNSAVKGVESYSKAAPLGANAAQESFRAGELAADAGNAVSDTANVASGAAEAASTGADIAGNASSVAGPIGAAIGGVMKGKYDEAAGAALGSVVGAYFGPIGSMIGSKLGGMVGDKVGNLIGVGGSDSAPAADANASEMFGFGFADGTVDTTPGKFVPKSMWERLTSSSKPKEAPAPAPQPSQNNSMVNMAKEALGNRAKQLADQERKAVGFADGSPAVGGKGVQGPYFQELNRPYNPTSAGQAQLAPNAGSAQGGKGVPSGVPSGAPAGFTPVSSQPNQGVPAPISAGYQDEVRPWDLNAGS